MCLTPLGQNLLHVHAVFRKKMVKQVGAPLWEILDPPLDHQVVLIKILSKSKSISDEKFRSERHNDHSKG